MQAVYKTYIDVVHVKKSQTARTFTVAQPATDASASQVSLPCIGQITVPSLRSTALPAGAARSSSSVTCMCLQDPTSQPDADAEPRLQMDDVTPEQAAASEARLQVHASAGSMQTPCKGELLVPRT